MVCKFGAIRPRSSVSHPSRSDPLREAININSRSRLRLSFDILRPHLDFDIPKKLLMPGRESFPETHLNSCEGEATMKALKLLQNLRRDEDGAALIEYTVLLGILVVAVVATIVAVGGWVNGQWTALNTAINP
jgi:pilus assembly protein Flp/PilA